MDDTEKLKQMRKQAEGMALRIAELKKKIEEWAKERERRQATHPEPSKR
jgi:hypothetical protein